MFKYVSRVNGNNIAQTDEGQRVQRPKRSENTDKDEISQSSDIFQDEG